MTTETRARFAVAWQLADLMTLLVVLRVARFQGNELGLGAQVAYALAGLAGIVVMKLFASGLVFGIVRAAPRWWLIASTVGVVGVLTNLASYWVVVR